MSLLTILYNMTIHPLELLFSFIFSIACRVTGSEGLAIVALSLVMNILVLPLYRRADALQKEERELEEKLQPYIDHFKKAFKGDEQFMVLQTFYRQNNYKPTNALKGTLSLLLQIPFFTAAYRFLSGLEMLKGQSFLFIKDLGAPDGLLTIAGLAINILPILMTIINLISSSIYTKDAPLKSKIQLYVMAGLFLVLLYRSPSGLAFYWTLNNTFSLGKNIVMKSNHPKPIVYTLLGLLGCIVLYFSFTFQANEFVKRFLLILLGVACFMPMIMDFLKKKISIKKNIFTLDDSVKSYFWFGVVLLAILTGALIPSAVISSSAGEFMLTNEYVYPTKYIWNALSIASGFFVVWFGVYYLLAKPEHRKYYSAVILVLVGIALVDYMLFGTKLGDMSERLINDGLGWFSQLSKLKNIIATLGISCVLYALHKWKDNLVPIVYVAGIVAMGIMSFTNVQSINKELANYEETIFDDEMPTFTLSRKGKNVVVLMLDRALTVEVPYILKEFPELKEEFDGFTYYPNTLSHGQVTNSGSPGLFGGYEYTPKGMRERPELLLSEKHDQALKLLPRLFLEEGYDVAFLNPPYAGYQWVPDLSVFDELEGMKAYNSNAYYTVNYANDDENLKYTWERNFFCYSLTKISPVWLQPILYNDGMYNEAEYVFTGTTWYQKVNESGTTAFGQDREFLASYYELTHMVDMTEIVEEGNSLLLMNNLLPHSPQLLQLPGYEISMEVDNTEYMENMDPNFYVIDGKELMLTSSLKNTHYHSNVLTMKVLSEWFDYLRENGVYDNTRIILVSDHGRSIRHFGDVMVMKEELGDGDEVDLETFFAYYFVKDFDAHGFTIDETFMTNADTPSIALEGIVENPTNPYTGNPINMDAKEEPIEVLRTGNWSTVENNGYVFLPDKWFSFSGQDIQDFSNWTYLGEY